MAELLKTDTLTIRPIEPETGQILYTGEGEYLVYSNNEWLSFSSEKNYQEQLSNIPIEEIEKYLRKEKLERINKK